MGERALVDQHRETLAEQCKSADPADLKAGEALRMAVGGHTELLEVESTSEGFEVDFGIGGSHAEVGFAAGRVLLDNEGLVHAAGWEADGGRDLRGGADGVVEGEDLVWDVALLEEAESGRFWIRGSGF